MLPPLGKLVLVRSFAGGVEVRYLVEVKGTMSDTGEQVVSLYWYPNGLPLENSVAWAEIPKEGWTPV
jgi:hypothetical protein